MSIIRKIIRDDGSLERYERERIVGSILNAIRAAGHRDEWMADKIAPMVEVALAKYFGDRPPSVNDVAHYVEQALRALDGLGPVADAYLENRVRARNLRVIEGDAALEAPLDLAVAPSSGDGLVAWERKRIEAALVREENLSPEQARAVASAVEARVRRIDPARISTVLIRELVGNELIERGMRPPELGPSQLSLPVYDVDQAIFPEADVPMEAAVDSPRALERFTGGAMMRQYTLARVHSRQVAEAHLDGSIELLHTDHPQRLSGITLDCRGLGGRGCGFGLDAFLPDAVSDGVALAGRIATLVAEVVDMGVETPEFAHLDTAFAGYVRSQADARLLAAALLERIDLASRGSTVTLTLDALAGRMDQPGSLLFARALLDAFDDAPGRRNAACGLVLRLGAAAATDPEAFALLERAAARAKARGGARFRFVRERRRGEDGSLFGAESNVTTIRSSRVVAARCVLNLLTPLLDGGAGFSAYTSLLDERVMSAARALVERQNFIERFFTRRRLTLPGLGPALGRALVSGSRVGHLHIVGLHEASRFLLADAPDAGRNALLRAAQQIVSYLRFRLDECSARLNTDIELNGDADAASAARPLRTFGHGRRERFDRLFPDGCVALSAGFALPAGGDWEARLEAEARLHPLATHATLTLRPVSDHVHHPALVQFLLRMAATTEARPWELNVAAVTQRCGVCGYVAPPALADCPACGANQWMRSPGQKALFDADTDVSVHSPQTRGTWSVMEQ